MILFSQFQVSVLFLEILLLAAQGMKFIVITKYVFLLTKHILDQPATIAVWSTLLCSAYYFTVIPLSVCA